MPSVSLHQQKWETLSSCAEEWFHAPDLEGLRIIFSSIAAHYDKEIEPIWLFVVGPSSTGKTALAINSLSRLDQSHVIGDLSTKTFLSSYGGNHQSGLLSRLDNSAIFLFKDFTTFLSKRPDDRAQIAGQLREIYDGRWNRETGAGKTLEWRGKITAIAACTPAIERAWAIHRELGERFVTLRWKAGDDLGIARTAMRQRGKERAIRQDLQAKTADFIYPSRDREVARLGREAEEALIALSCLVSPLRGHVVREGSGKREIIDVVAPEGPSRLIKVMDSIVRYHATLFGRLEANSEDISLARRVAFDSIPPARYKIFKHIPTNEAVGWTELARAVSLNRTSLLYHLAEMEALNILQSEEDDIEASYSFTESFRTHLINIPSV